MIVCIYGDADAYDVGNNASVYVCREKRIKMKYVITLFPYDVFL